jgi:hypothetical protein
MALRLKRASKAHIVEAAQAVLKKYFPAKRYLGFSLLLAKVSPFDEKYCYWPVRIRHRKFVATIGSMEFFGNGTLKKCSGADGVKGIIETLMRIQSSKRRIRKQSLV